MYSGGAGHIQTASKGQRLKSTRAETQARSSGRSYLCCLLDDVGQGAHVGVGAGDAELQQVTQHQPALVQWPRVDDKDPEAGGPSSFGTKKQR